MTNLAFIKPSGSRNKITATDGENVKQVATPLGIVDSVSQAIGR